MKNIITTLALVLVTSISLAQVGIGTKTPDPSAILEVTGGDATVKKGFLPPRVNTAERNGIASPPAGLVIYNTTDSRLEFSNGTHWINLTDGSVITPINNAANTGNGGVGIGTKNPDRASILDLASTVKGFLPPRLSTSERSGIANPAEGLTIFNTTSGCIEFFNGQGWVNVCDRNVTPPPPSPLPGNIVLQAGLIHYITSINDNDYFPYTAPTGPANLSQFAADGIADPILDIQGILTTTGVIIQIPYTVSSAPVDLPAFTQTVNVPASLTEDGMARNVTLSYTAQTLAVGSGFINATLKAEINALNIVKLDLINGLGDGSEVILVNSLQPTTKSVYGLLLATFTLSLDSSSNTGEVQLRATTCKNDVSVGAGPVVAMLYDYDGNGTKEYCWCAREVNVQTEIANGNPDSIIQTWLDRNQGAYRLATSTTDASGFGDLYQWGRAMDGHQKRRQRNNDPDEGGGTQGTMVNGTTTTRADNPNNALFITRLTTDNPRNWRLNPATNLWSGTAAVNNPCPLGYRVPIFVDFRGLRSTSTGAPTLNLTLTGRRQDNGGGFFQVNNTGYLWTADPISDTALGYINTDGNSVSAFNWHRAAGFAVRCIKN